MVLLEVKVPNRPRKRQESVDPVLPHLASRISDPLLLQVIRRVVVAGHRLVFRIVVRHAPGNLSSRYFYLRPHWKRRPCHLSRGTIRGWHHHSKRNLSNSTRHALNKYLYEGEPFSLIKN
jgi:hypothetical protein